MMKTGNVDACEVTVEGAMDVEKAGFKTVKIASDAMTLDVSGAYNSKTKGMPTADVRVRQALSLAINRDEMSKTLFYGRASKPMPSFVGEFSQDVDLAYWRQQAATAYRYDPAEAKRLLTAAGYPDGFTIKLYAHKAISILPKLAEVVQANWLAIGVKADLQIIEESTLSDWRDADDMRLMGQAYLNDCGGYRWNSLRILRMVHSWSQKNWHMTDNAFPRLDAIADAYESETDAAKRKDLMAEAIKISMDSYVLDQLVLSPMTIAYNSNKIVADYPPAASEAAEAVLARFAPYYKHK
jgi:ABC-type transport system substrate-binding protein